MKNEHLVDWLIRAGLFFGIIYGVVAGQIAGWWLITAAIGLAYFGKTAYTGACVIYQALGISTLPAKKEEA